MDRARGTLVPFFSVGSGGVLTCVPVATDDDQVKDRSFDEHCSS